MLYYAFKYVLAFFGIFSMKERETVKVVRKGFRPDIFLLYILTVMIFKEF